jgi:DNA-binding transcriptional MerR regulator
VAKKGTGKGGIDLLISASYDLTNCYTAQQTAQLLGLSVKRVRQLPAEGKLTERRGADGRVLFEQLEVNNLRLERQALGKTTLTRTRRDDGTLEEIRRLLEQNQENAQKAITATQEAFKVAEENYLATINRQRAEIEELSAQLRARRRRLFRWN